MPAGDPPPCPHCTVGRYHFHYPVAAGPTPLYETWSGTTYPKIPGVRPSWDEVWMDLATSLSLRSTCSRLQVGCVVVTADNQRVLGIGYNGGPKGISNECLSSEPGLCGHLHAEVNALIKADYTSTVPKKMYVTNQPCYQCAVAIVNADIREVVYRYPYRLTDGLELLEKAGVCLTKMPG